MELFSRRVLLIPALTVFLLLMLDSYILSRDGDVAYLYQEPSGLEFPAFSTIDLMGNAVTQEIFTGELSIVCLWVTQDAEGSRELFARLYELQGERPDSLQMIGILGDVRDTDPPEKIDNARSIVRDFPQGTRQILSCDDMTDFLRRIRSAPTACFVDENGMIVGQAVVGNEPELIKKEFHRLAKTDPVATDMERRIQSRLLGGP